MLFLDIAAKCTCAGHSVKVGRQLEGGAEKKSPEARRDSQVSTQESPKLIPSTCLSGSPRARGLASVTRGVILNSDFPHVAEQTSTANPRQSLTESCRNGRVLEVQPQKYDIPPVGVGFRRVVNSLLPDAIPSGGETQLKLCAQRITQTEDNRYYTLYVVKRTFGSIEI